MEGDGLAQSLQAEPSLSKKWKETGQLSPYSPNRASPRSGKRRASSVLTGGTEPLQEVEGDGPAQSLQAEPSFSQKWKETGQLSPYSRNQASSRSSRRRASSVPTAPTEPLQEVEGDGPAQSLQAEPSLSKKWKETGQLSHYRRNRASPRSGRRRASSFLTGGAENLPEVEGDGPAQSIQPQQSLFKKWKETGQLSPYRRSRASPRSGRRRASSVPTAPTEPLQEVERDGPAQSLQAEPSLSKKWKETGQLSPYRRNRASPRSGIRRASSVPTGGTEPLQEVEGDGPAQSLQSQPSLSEKFKETGQLSPYRRSRVSPRSGRRRASSVQTAPTEPLQEVERDGPAQSLQAEPSLSKKWKETGQLSPYRRSRASPRSGRRRASSVLTGGTEPLQEVEGDGPAQSLQAEPSLSQKWKETGQLSPYSPNRASPRSGRRRASSVLTGGTEPLQELEGDGLAQSLQEEPSLSQKWKETGQLIPYRRSREFPRSGRRRASSVLTGGTEPLQELEGDGPAQSLQEEPSLSQKWKETGQLSPYRRSRESPRSGRRRASSVLTGGTEPLQELEGDGPAQSLKEEPSLSQKWKETGQLIPYRRSRESPRSGRRRASSVPTAPTEPLQEVEGDGPAQSLQAEPSLSKKWKETGQLSPYSPYRAFPRSGKRRASSVLTGGTEPLQEVEGDGPAQSLQAEPSLSKNWKETGQLTPYRRSRESPRSGRRRASSVLTGGTEPLQELEGDGPAQSLKEEPSLSQKWKETGQLIPYRRSRESPRSGRRRASSVPTAPTEPLQEVEGDGPAQSLQAHPSLSKKWKETGQLSPYSPNRAFPRSGKRRASSVPTGGTEPLPEVEGDGPAQSLQAEPSRSKKWKETGQLSPYRRNRASPRIGRRRASSVLTVGTKPLQEVEGDGPAQSLQPQPSLSKKWKETGQLSPYRRNRASPRIGRRRASSVTTGGTEPLPEVEGDGPAHSLQAEPRISQKWKETGQLSPYSPNRASPRIGRRRASSVLTGGAEPLQEVEGNGPAQSLQPQPSLSKKWKETGQLSPYRRSRASPRSGRRRASSVPTAPTEPLQEMERDGPAQSLHAEPSLSKKWKETGQLSHYRRNRASPRSGRRRASSVLTGGAENLPEVEGDGPAQSLQPQQSLSKKWKETGQLSPYSPNRASPRSGRRRASSVTTGGTEPLPEVEGDGPAQSSQAEPRISQKWKETGQLSPYSPNRASPRSGRRRASSVLTGGAEPLQEVEGDGPAQSLQPQPSLSKKWKETGQLSPSWRNRASPRSGRRRASSVPTGGTEPLPEVEGDGPAQSLQAEPSLSQKWKETGQLSPYSRNQASPRSGRRRASSVPTAPTETLQEVEGDGPAQSLQAEPSLSKNWKETGQLSHYRRNRASPRSGRRRASSFLTGGAENLPEVEGDGPAQSLQPQQSLSKNWKETGQLSPYRRSRASPRSGRRRASSVPTAPTEPLQEVERDGPAQSLQAEPSLSKKWKETGQLSPYSPNRASPRSGKRRASSVLTGGTEPLQELEGDGPAQSLQEEPSLSQKWKETGQLIPYRRSRESPRSGRRRASSVPTAPTEPLQELEGDGPAQSLQAEPSLSKKWKETGQLSPYSPNRASPRSGRRRASSVLTGGAEPLQEVEGDGPAQSLQPQPSLSKKWKETGQLSPYSPNRASPRNGKRRASSVLTCGTEPLQEVEGDGPAQSLQEEPSLSQKWKETGQLSPHRRSRESPRSGRRRASSVPTAPTEPLQEVEGDGPAQSLQPQPSLSKKWKETGQLSDYRRNRASPRSGRRRASSVLTGGAENLPEVEGDGPAQSLQPQQSLSKKWKETGQLSPYRRSRASPRSGRRRASSVPTAPTEPFQEVERDGPAQSFLAEPSLSKKWKETGQLSPYRRNRASPRSGRRRASSVTTGGTEPLPEVEGDGPAQSLQSEPSLSKKWKETGQLSPYSPNRDSPRSGRRRASSVLTGGAEPLQEVEGDGPAQSLQPQPSLSKNWKETGQLSPYSPNRASPRNGKRRASSVLTCGTEPLQEVEGDGPAQSLQEEPSLSQKWKETGQLSPHRRSRESPRSGRRRASSVPTAPTEPLQEVEGDGPAQSLQAEPSLSKKWKETGQLSPYSPNRASPRSGRRRASSVPTAPTEPLQEMERDGPAQSLHAEPSLSKKWKETGQLSHYRRNRASPRSGRRRASSVLTGGAENLPEVEGDGPAQSLQPQQSLSKKWKETGQLSPYSPNRASPRSGRRRASSVTTGGTEPLPEVEGDGPAQSSQAEPRISQKWKETGQLSPYSPNRASPRSGRRRASSVLTGGAEPLQEVEGDGPAQSLQPQPSLSKKWKETGQLSPSWRNRASPRSGRRRASSVPTGGTEPLPEVEGDGPAQSLQAEPSLSQKWKETGQLSPYSRNQASPRSGRRRASSVPTAPTETLQEVEGDGPAQSLQAEPSLSKKWKETGQLSPYSPNRASPRIGRRRASSVPTAPTEPLQEMERDGPAQSLHAEPSLSKKWKETGQLSHYRRNRASPRSGRRRASSVLTGGAENLPEVEGDGPAQSLQPQQSLSKKWKETGQLSPYSPNRASPRSGRRRASSLTTGGTEPLPEVEGDGPAQSSQAEPRISQKWKETGQLSPYSPNRASPRSGRRRASSVLTGGAEPLQEVEGDGPAQSLQPQPSLSKKWKETGQLSPSWRNRASPRSGRRRASSVPTGGTEPLPEVEGDGPAQSLQAEPSLSQKWKETGQLSPYSQPSPLPEVEGDGPAQSLQAEPRISQKWKETGQLSPYRRNRASPRIGRRRASSVTKGGTEPLPGVEGDGPAHSLQAEPRISQKWSKETAQLSPYSPNRASPRSGRRRASSVLTGASEPLQEVEGDGPAQSLQPQPSLSKK